MTITTLLNRLLKKRAITANEEWAPLSSLLATGRAFPISFQSSGLIDRLFDGRVTPLVAHFSEHRKLGKEDLEELKRLIQEIEHE